MDHIKFDFVYFSMAIKNIRIYVEQWLTYLQISSLVEKIPDSRVSISICAIIDSDLDPSFPLLRGFQIPDKTS